MSTEAMERSVDAAPNGHSPLAADHSFDRAFDAGEVTWVNDVPVFDAALAVHARRHQWAELAPPIAPGPSTDISRPVSSQRAASRAAPAPALPTPPKTAPATHHAVTPPATIKRLRARDRETLAVTPAHVTWLAVLPIFLVTVVAGWVGTVLASSIVPDASWTGFLTLERSGSIRPEPVDQVRYLVSLASPLLLVALTHLAWKQVSGLKRGRRLNISVIAVQVAGLALIAVSWIAQRNYPLVAWYPNVRHHWFSGWNLVAALAVACLLLALARMTGLFAVPLASRSRVVRWLSLGAVLTTSGFWLLPSVFHGANLADADEVVRFHLQFTYDEFLSVLNGRTPLVDFVPLYSRVLPFALEPVMRIFDSTAATFTWMMWALSVAAVLAVYLMLRIVTGDPLRALVLFVPVLTMTTFSLRRAGDERIFLANLYELVPLRVVGPFVVAWLCARHLQRPRRGGSLVAFFVAGLVAINNPEFGFASFAALGAGLWCGGDKLVPGWRRAGIVAVQGVVGGLASVVVFSLFILARSSSLPRLDYLTHFQRVFAIEGFGMVPMPLLGLHVAIYLTFVAALVGAAVSAIKGCSPERRVLTGMLAYSGVLGLGSWSYWVGRSHPIGLFAQFPTWALCVSLLTWWVLTAVAGRRSASAARVRVWALPSLAVLTAFGLMISAILQFPAPGPQVRRLAGTATAKSDGGPLFLHQSGSSFDRSPAVRFVAAHTRPGENVGILATLGHGIAERSGVVNVSPYAHPDSIVFDEQMAFVVKAVERAGGRKIFLGPSYPEIPAYLERHGYVIQDQAHGTPLLLYVRQAQP